MIDIFFIGIILSYLQYNKYINSSMNERDFEISRYGLIIVYVYQYINALLLLSTIIYLIYLVEYILIGVNKQYNLIYLLLNIFPHYKNYFVNNNIFLQQFMFQFFIGLVLSYFIIILIIIFRGSSKSIN